MATESELTQLIEHAIKAPSGHNTQPWRFKVLDEEIQIHPDPLRALPVVDHDDHALYISLGCAAENIVIAASDLGIHADLSIVRNSGEKDFIRIGLTRDANVERDELIDYIQSRQSTRTEYSDETIPTEHIRQLEASFDFQGVRVLMFDTRKEVEKLKPFIIEGSNLQFRNKRFVNELVEWIRFSRSEARGRADGIWVSSMGVPNLGKFVGNMAMKAFVTAKSEAKRWDNLLNATAGLSIFTTRENNPWYWVTLGRAFQRFGLTATKLDIRHAHVNMPCEEPEVRKKLAHHLRLTDEYPLLLLRFGYGEKMPYSYRRDLNEVVVREGGRK